MSIKLSDFEPKITPNGFLTFICPTCKDHKIRVPLEPQKDSRGQSWKHQGELPNLSLQPSIDAGCWHGNIVNGELKP